jgi:protein-tyrosine phosphatase
VQPDRRSDLKLDIHWTTIGAGRLALWHRPGRRHFSALHQVGVTHLVTLLSESEGARTIGDQARAAGIGWIWLPLQGAKEPPAGVRPALDAGLAEASNLLDQGASLLIHCSAGIHRTGMFAYALLRHRNQTRDAALSTIEQSRRHTREGLNERHLVWGDNVAARSSA